MLLEGLKEKPWVLGKQGLGTCGWDGSLTSVHFFKSISCGLVSGKQSWLKPGPCPEKIPHVVEGGKETDRNLTLFSVP